LLGDLIVPGDLISAHWSSVLLGAAVMVLSLLAYFVSMVTAFVVVMAALVGFGDSQMRTTRLAHPAVSVIAGSDRDALTNVDKAKEAQKAAEARKAAEAQKAAEAREAAKKLARVKLARERKQAALARQRQEREARDSALAWGNPGQYSGQYGGGSRLYSYAPGGFDR
jgi:flagellar biosynthesis component FlhA